MKTSLMVRALSTAAALALVATGIAGCDSGQNTPDPSETPAPVATSEATASPTPQPEATTAAPEPGAIREPAPGITNEQVAASVRSNYPTWPEMSDEEIVAALNAGCDGLDQNAVPDSGVQAIAAHGVSEIDAAFGLLVAIGAYCPEYSSLLK